MSKKKAIKIATATAIATTAFVATAPVQSEAASNPVDKSVKKAKDQIRKAYDTYQKAAKQGKLASYSAMQKEITLAKKYYKAALAVADKKGGKKRGNYRKQIFDQKKLLTYAERYAYTVNINVTSAQANLEKALNSDNADEVIAARSALNSKLYAFNKSLAQVYGTDARKVLNSKYASPAKVKLANAAAVLAVYNAYKQIEDNLEIGKTSEAGLQIENVKADLDKLRASSSNFAKKVVAYAEKINEQYQQAISIYGSVKAVNSTTVEVTFKNGADASKFADKSKFTIEGLTIENALVKQGASNVILLTTSAQVAGKDYVVKHDGKTAGSFKGVAANGEVKDIKLHIDTNAVEFGKNKELVADVGVAGIEVTFAIDAPAGSLNDDKVLTAVSGQDGKAKVSYTRYEAGTDTITAYVTGDRTKQAVDKLVWGSETSPALSVVSVSPSSGKAANGASVTYKVKFSNPADLKEAVANAKLRVTFKEHLNKDFSTQLNAQVTNPITGETVTPYQSENNNQAALEIETDDNGIATFTVTGKNTSVTPIVWVDNLSAYHQQVTEKKIYAGDDDQRLDTRELRVYAPATSFEGAQAAHSIEVKAERTSEATLGNSNGRVYNVEVKDKDGKAYGGGVVTVGLKELDVDDSLNSETDAIIFHDNNDPAQDGTILGGNGTQQIKLRLDKNGKGEFTLVSNTQNDSATPVVWIDQNYDDTNHNKKQKLDKGEANKIAESTNFQKARVADAKLKKDDIDAGTQFTYEFLNQSGKAYLPDAPGTFDGQVSFNVENTGDTPIVITNGNLDNFRVTRGATIAADGTVTVEVGRTATVTGNIDKTTKGFISIRPLNTQSANPSVSVTATGVTSDKQLDPRDQSKSFTVGPVTDVLTVKYVPGTGGEYKGEIVAFDTKDKDGKFGKITIKRGDGSLVVIPYGLGDRLRHYYSTKAKAADLIDADYNSTTPINDVVDPNNPADYNEFDLFERALNVGDGIRVRYNQESSVFDLVNIGGVAADNKDKESGNRTEAVSRTLSANTVTGGVAGTFGGKAVTYVNAGDVIPFTLTFTDDAFVKRAGQFESSEYPFINFLLAGTDRKASYAAGNGSENFTLQYTVAATDQGPIDVDQTGVLVHGEVLNYTGKPVALNNSLTRNVAYADTLYVDNAAPVVVDAVTNKPDYQLKVKLSDNNLVGINDDTVKVIGGTADLWTGGGKQPWKYDAGTSTLTINFEYGLVADGETVIFEAADKLGNKAVITYKWNAAEKVWVKQ